MTYEQEFLGCIDLIPVVTAQNPLGWDYHCLGMATGQAVIGTGAITGFLSSFSDLFGAQSKSYNEKIQNALSLCFSQLRIKTIEAGGNAVIAVDVDYSEVGTKAMLMVCMTGTIVNLKNLDTLYPDAEKKIKQAFFLKDKIMLFQKIQEAGTEY